MPRLHVRAVILVAMMRDPDKAWTRRQLVDDTRLDMVTITKSAAACVRAGILTRHQTGDNRSSPVSYTLTELGRQWGVVYGGALPGGKGKHG